MRPSSMRLVYTDFHNRGTLIDSPPRDGNRGSIINHHSCDGTRSEFESALKMSGYPIQEAKTVYSLVMRCDRAWRGIRHW